MPGGTHEQHALGDPAAEAGELPGILEEIDDLLELFLHLVDTGDVVEGVAAGALGLELRLGLAEAHRSAVGALEVAHEPDEQEDHDDQRQEREQPREEQALVVFHFVDLLDACALERGEQVTGHMLYSTSR